MRQAGGVKPDGHAAAVVPQGVARPVRATRPAIHQAATRNRIPIPMATHPSSYPNRKPMTNLSRHSHRDAGYQLPTDMDDLSPCKIPQANPPVLAERRVLEIRLHERVFIVGWGAWQPRAGATPSIHGARTPSKIPQPDMLAASHEPFGLSSRVRQHYEDHPESRDPSNLAWPGRRRHRSGISRLPRNAGLRGT